MGIENCFQHKIYILPLVSNNRIGRVRFYDGEAAAAATQEVQVQKVPNQKNSKLVAVRVAYLHKNGDGISSVALCSGCILNSFYTPMSKPRPHLFTTDLEKVSLYFDEEELRSHQTVAHPDLADDPRAWQEEVRRWLRIQRTID
jgi:hypothetical protein